MIRRPAISAANIDNTEPEAEQDPLAEKSACSAGNEPNLEKFTAGKFRTFLLALLLVSLFVGVSFLCCGRPKFETNDDVVLSMVAGGVGFADKPDEHILYSHYFIGRALNYLYAKIPTIAWYSVYLFSAQIMAMTGMVYLILKRSVSLRSAAIILPLFFFAVCLRPTQLMQFTTTATLVSCAGAMFLFDALEKKADSWRQAIMPLALSFLLFFAGAAIRFGSAKLVVGFSGMYLIAWAFTKLDWRRLKIGVVFLAVIYLLTCAMEKHNEAYYQKNGWNEFYSFNVLRFGLTEFGRATDYNMSPKVISDFKRVAWSHADYSMLCLFYVLDRDRFSMEKLQQLDKSLPKLKEIDLPAICTQLFSVLKNGTILPVLLAISASLLFIEKSVLNWRSKFLYIAGLLCAALVLLLTAKLPVYVFSGIAGFSCSLFLLSAASNANPVAGGWLKRTAVGITLLVLLFSTAAECLDFRQKSDNIALRNGELKSALSGLDTQPLYVACAYTFPFEVLRPFDNLSEYFHGMKLIGINFLGRTPISSARLQEFGITDLMKEIAGNSIKIISSPFFNEKIYDYVLEHYSMAASFKPELLEPKIPFNVFKVSVAPAQNSAIDTDEQWRKLLVCRPRGEAEELSLFPGKDSDWRLNEMRKIKKPLLNYLPGYVTTCPNCGVPHDGSRYFQSSGRLPTMSHYGDLHIKTSDFGKFFIEIAAPEEMIADRLVLVEFNLPQSNKSQLVINLKNDGRLHRYEFDMSKVNLQPDGLVTQINVHPVYLRDAKRATDFEIRRFGFIRSR